MSDNPFEMGDIVRLNSGGPDMTVVHVGDENVGVAWLADDGTPHWRQLDWRCIEGTDD